MGKLLGRVDIEILTRKLNDLRPQCIEFFLGGKRDTIERCLVDGRTSTLHAR